MSARALSEEAMRASLHDISLPASAAGGVLAEIAVTIGLAGVAAVLVACLLRLFSLRTQPTPQDSLEDHLAKIESLPEDRRRVVLLHLLRQHAPARYAEVARDLYRLRSSVTTQALRAELDRLV
ncbi:MAG: hypothetical protein AAF999_12290 [Pseudomonadota bacterium]